MTVEDRDLISDAITYTYEDYYRRTGMELAPKTKRTWDHPEEYDTSWESFAYQYGYVQHNYAQYCESSHAFSGRVNIISKKYLKKKRKQYESQDMLAG